MIVQFPVFRLQEYPNARAFGTEVGPWLVVREAENCYLLGDLPRLIWEQDNRRPSHPRFFAIKDREQIAAAAIVHPAGGLAMTWASFEMVAAMAAQLHAVGVRLDSVFAPGYVSWQFAQAWGKLTGLQLEGGREERIYQLARLRHKPAATGQLAVATVADDAFVAPWLKSFAREAHYQTANTLEEIRTMLYAESRLFIWRDPNPVGMAAWVSPTPHGGSINLVYVPSEHRGHGHGKSVVAALAKRMLVGGTRYCFILTDIHDMRTNHLYQSLGARTISELLQCNFKPATATTGEVAIGTLNVATNSGGVGQVGSGTLSSRR